MSAAALTRSTAEPASAPHGAAVALKRVSKSFGAQAVLNAVSLQVQAGQFLAVVGRSGSGKSTLLRLLGGLDQPTAGEVLLDGAPAASAAVRIMFQEPRLLPWARVADNVTVGLRKERDKREARGQALAALQAVGLEARAGEWPAVLSGGQKQRFALARALVSRPKLLLLDEPLGALDALTRLDMQDLVARAWAEQHFTAVLVTHDVAEAVRLADHIVLLESGAVTLDVDNPAPHPRAIRSAHSAELEERILSRLMGR